MSFKSTRKSRRHRTPRQENQLENDAFFQPLATTHSEPVQTKLTVGAPDDKYEREADAVADRVVSSGNQAESPAIQTKPDSRMEEDRAIQEKHDKSARPRVQRMVESKEEEPVQRNTVNEEEPIQQMGGEEEEPIQKMGDEEDEPIQQMDDEEEEPVQTKTSASNASQSPDLSTRLRRRAGTGRSLQGKTRAQMEAGFGRDFSKVNIHTDAAADEMNRQLGAKAFARGQDIYFRSGEYNPETGSGQRLLAHELTHTVQQGGGEAASKTSAPAVQRHWKKETGWPSLGSDEITVKITLKFSGAVLNKSSNAAVNTTALAAAAKRQIENSYRGKVRKNAMGIKVVYDVRTAATVRGINKLSQLNYGAEHLLIVLDDANPRVNGTYGRAPFYGTIVYLNEKHISGMISGSDINTIPHEVGHTAGLHHLMEKREEGGLVGKAVRAMHHLTNKDNMMWRGGGHPSYSSADSDRKLTETNSEQLEGVSKNISDKKLNKVNYLSFAELFLLP